LNYKKITAAAVTTSPALTIAATAVVMTTAATAVALLGLHIQILCLQFLSVILNLRVSTLFELADKIRHKLFKPHNGFGRKYILESEDEKQAMKTRSTRQMANA
jgi:hypothetical protein